MPSNFLHPHPHSSPFSLICYLFTCITKTLGQTSRYNPGAFSSMDFSHPRWAQPVGGSHRSRCRWFFNTYNISGEPLSVPGCAWETFTHIISFKLATGQGIINPLCTGVTAEAGTSQILRSWPLNSNKLAHIPSLSSSPWSVWGDKEIISQYIGIKTGQGHGSEEYKLISHHRKLILFLPY